MTSFKDTDILVIRFKFLPLTETFNYDELQYLSKYRPYVFCHVRKNSDVFPYACFVPGSGSQREGLLSELFYDYCMPRFLRKINKKCDLKLVGKFIRLKGIRVVHAHFFDELLFALELKERVSFKLIITFHGGQDLCAFEGLVKAERARAIAAVDMFIVKAEYMKHMLLGLGVPDVKICVFHRGVDTDFWSLVVKEGLIDQKKMPQIAFVGRCFRKKGVLEVVHAIKALKGVTWILVLSADAFTARLMKFLTQLLRYGRIEADTFLPEYLKLWILLRMKSSVISVWNIPAKDVRLKMITADVVVVPSMKTPKGAAEGIPRVLLEAQALGKPVVAYDSGGCNEGLIDQKTGFLVREGDRQGFVAKIRLLMDRAVAARMGSDARVFIQQNFSIQRNIEVLEKVYDK